MSFMKMLLISFISLMLSSCQPSCCKKRKKSTLYDQAVIKQACEQAACEEQAFAHFKKNSFFSLLYPSFSYEEAVAVVEKETTLLEKIKEIDAIADPELLSFGVHGQFSLAAVRHLYVAQQLREKFKDLSPKHIVIIGVLDAGLCQLLQEVYHPEHITLVDLPEPLALARKVLHKQKIEHVDFFTPDQLPLSLSSDLVVSDGYFSVCAKEMQEQLIACILSHARAGFIFAHLYPKQYETRSLTPKELKERLQLTMSEEKEEYHFTWDLKI